MPDFDPYEPRPRPPAHPRTGRRPPHARHDTRVRMPLERDLRAWEVEWERSQRSSEDAAAQDRRARRDERRRREAARRRRQRLATSVAVALLLVTCSCLGLTRALMPRPVAPRAARSVIPDPDLATTALAVATRVQRLAPAALRPKTPPLRPMTPAPGVRTIVLDKGDQTVTLYEADGKPVGRWPCSSGVYYPRLGTYEVTSHKEQSYYPADGSRFYHFTIFTRSEKGTNIGFHSLPIDREGNMAEGLGKPVSHGCVRLAPDRAEFVFGWARVGTKVIVRE